MGSHRVNFAIFSRLSAPNDSGTSTASPLNGTEACSHRLAVRSATRHPHNRAAEFHWDVQHDLQSPLRLALHNMGVGPADGIRPGAAAPKQLRTAPLRGLGQRLLFLHDGRTCDLIQANPGTPQYWVGSNRSSRIC